jgi:hypothetical protein
MRPVLEGTRIQQQLAEVEALARAWLVRSIQAVCIELAGCNVFYPDMPDITRAVAYGIELDDPFGL